MAESSDLFGLVENIALNLELSHDTELSKMLQEFSFGNLSFERN
jgi:hypothetical protein